MTVVNYPVVVHAPHFEVLAWDRRSRKPESTNWCLYRSRGEAESKVDVLRLPGDLRMEIAEYDTAYFVRCVVCGDAPEGREVAFPDWPGVVQYVVASPGWSHTAEMLVYCPNHRPDKET